MLTPQLRTESQYPRSTVDKDTRFARCLGPLSICTLLCLGVSEPLAARQYEAFPSTASRGEEIEVSLTSEGCEAENRHDLKNMQLDAPEGLGIKVSTVFAEDCLLVGKITVAKSARVANIKLWVRPSSDADSGTEKGGRSDPGQADFSITAITAQPLPPGLDAQVEVMWKVLPKKVVRDSFGTRVANNYYGVEVVIGNNSGFALQLAAVGFRNYKPLPEGTKGCSSSETGREYPTMPIDSYQIVRSSLERAQEVGFRHKLLSIFKMSGLLMTGFLPFYEAPSRAKTHYSGFTNIVNGPGVSGLGAIYPDTTINQLRRLDIQALRDGIIIPHNTHRRTMTFISKRVLFCGTDKPKNNLKPLQVTSALGELVLIGKQVQYLQRVQVVSNGSGAATPPVVIALPETEKKISRGLPVATELTLRGSSLNNATVEAPANVEGIKITEQTVNDAGDEIKIKATVNKEVAPGPYRLKVTTPNGSTDVEIQVVDPPPSAKAASIGQAITIGDPEAKEVTVSGTALKPVTKIEALDGTAVVGEVVFSEVRANDAGTEISAKATAAAAVEAGTYKLRFTHPEGTVDTEATIEVISAKED